MTENTTQAPGAWLEAQTTLVSPEVANDWAPKRIWLQQGNGEGGSHTWCEDSQAPEHEEASYIREDFTGTLSADYLSGHQDGLDWAAQMVTYTDPRTGDWLYDDLDKLAAAIRKGPDMSQYASPAKPEDARAGGFKDAIDAIRGAIACGQQNEDVPPAGHWLAEFWEIGQRLARPAPEALGAAGVADHDFIKYVMAVEALIPELHGVSTPALLKFAIAIHFKNFMGIAK